MKTYSPVGMYRIVENSVYRLGMVTAGVLGLEQQYGKWRTRTDWIGFSNP